MPAFCQAYVCSNQNRLGKPGYRKSYFKIPDPTKHPEKTELAARWLHNIRTSWTVKTFTFGDYKKVCEDHFSPDCFEENFQAKLLGYKPRRKLKEDAVPTIFSFKQANPET